MTCMCLLCKKQPFLLTTLDTRPSILLLQSSEPDEGSGPAGSGVPQSAPRGGGVSNSPQIQEGSCPEAEDPPAGVVPAAASGGPLSHRGVP